MRNTETISMKTRYRLDKKQKLVLQVQVVGTQYDENDPRDIHRHDYKTWRDATILDLQELMREEVK